MKTFRFILALALVCSLLAAPVWAVSDIEPGAGSDFFVRDTANVLSSATENAVIDYNATLDAQCDGAQLVVVTVSYLDEDADVAATRLMNDWGVGSAAQSNGMLLLLVANEHRGWLAIGAGLDRDFTGDMADEYLDDYFWPDVDRDRFDDAVQTLTGELYDWFLDYYDVQPETQYDAPVREPVPAGGTQVRTGFGGFATAVLLLLLFVVIFWVIGAASRFSRMRRWGYGGGFFPIFWFGGGRRYRTYRDQFRPQPPPPPPGGNPRGPMGFGGPGGFMGGGFGNSSRRPPQSAQRRRLRRLLPRRGRRTLQRRFPQRRRFPWRRRWPQRRRWRRTPIMQRINRRVAFAVRLRFFFSQRPKGTV